MVIAIQHRLVWKGLRKSIGASLSEAHKLSRLYARLLVCGLPFESENTLGYFLAVAA